MIESSQLRYIQIKTTNRGIFLEDYAKKLKKKCQANKMQENVRDAEEEYSIRPVRATALLIITLSGLVFFLGILGGDLEYAVFMSVFFTICAVSGILITEAFCRKDLRKNMRLAIALLAIVIFVGGFVLDAELSEWIWRNW